MHRYDPDWIGAVISGLFVGLSIFVATKVLPRERITRWTLIVAAATGVVLAFIIRSVLRHFGI